VTRRLNAARLAVLSTAMMTLPSASDKRLIDRLAETCTNAGVDGQPVDDDL